MSLLQDITGEATAKATDLPRLLRLCLLLASRLQNEALRQWARHELEGYPADVAVPQYRVMVVRNRGSFIGPFQTWQGTLDIPMSLVPDKAKQRLKEGTELRDSIAEYADLVTKVAASDDGVNIPWPNEYARLYATVGLQKGTQCTAAWMEISPSALVGMLDQIKTRVLDFALEIEAEFPGAANDGQPPDGSRGTRVTQIFNTTINGPVQNYAAGSSNVTQLANVRVGDWDSLSHALRSAGVTEGDIGELGKAVRDNADKSPEGVAARAKEWLTRLALRAGQGIAGLGSDVVAGVVTQAVLLYLGLSGG